MIYCYIYNTGIDFNKKYHSLMEKQLSSVRQIESHHYHLTFGFAM